MIDRTSQLSDNQLIERIKRARRWFQELRTSRQRFGSRSVKTYRNFTAAAYDIEVTNIGFNNRVVEVVFTPDVIKPGLGGVFDLQAVVTLPVGQVVEVIREDIVPANGISKWRFYLSGNDSFPTSYARLKFYIYSNSSGTFTASSV